MSSISEGASPARHSGSFGVLTPMIILAVVWLMIGITYVVEPGFYPFMVRVMVAPFLGLVATLIWWWGFTGLCWKDKLLVTGVFFGALLVLVLPHGQKGMLYLFAALPVAVTAWLAWLAFTSWLLWSPRKLGLVAVIVLVIGFFGLLRIKGIDGDFVTEYEWIWKTSSESKFLAETEKDKSGGDATLEKPTEVKAGPGDWPTFRGPQWDSVEKITTIGTDWKTNPPKVVWKHRIGPGWSSFAVVGKRLFTQQQRGEKEEVVCFDGDTGKEVWTYGVPTRFDEAIGGPGPRATPTYLDGKLYAQGANGNLLCLDAFTGKELWTRDLKTDTGAVPPTWGFSGSPFIHKGLVSVFAGALNKTLVAYKADTGELAWISSREAGKPELSYCSTHLFTIHGVEQLVYLSDHGATAYEPETGKLLWDHEWDSNSVVRCIQPALVDGTDILIGTGLGVGTQRIHLTLADGKWTATEVWKTTKFKPYYNDMVLYKGHAYGYDGNMFACIDLKSGEVTWKARGYGSGQTLLLEKQGLLVILTEKGEVALVEANPKAHKELARIKALEGKTWNHPVIAYGKLFVRNGEEIACLELPKADGLVKD